MSKDDSSYFLALNELRSNKDEAAKKHLELAVKKASPVIARRSMENLARLSDVQQRLKIGSEMIERYKDGEAYLFAAKDLYAQSEFQQLINLTNNLSFSECPSELVSL